jgi:hypothetical protein
MESVFGFDFATVRVHHGSEDAAAIRAKAFTSGRHIWFAPGYYTNEATGLLAHELSHVVQQATGEAASLLHATLVDPRRAALEGRAHASARRLQSDGYALSPERRLALPAAHAAREVVQFDFEQDALAQLHRMPPDDAAGLAVRRQRLRQLFSSLGPEDARRVLDRLRNRRRGDRLSEQFHDILATATRQELQGILETRASVAPEPAPPVETTARNTWPFPGFSRPEAARYVDEVTSGVAVNLVRGVVILEVEGRDAPLVVPVQWFETTDRDVVPFLPVRRSREAAVAEVERAAVLRERRGWTPVAFYRDESGLVWPTVFNPQTAPRIMTVYPEAFESARRDVAATRDAFVELLFWYIGARTVGRVRTSPGTSVGRLIVARGRVLSPDELAVAARLVREGRTVRALAESTRQGVRTADFIVDGIRTELKTIRNLTSGDLSGALGRRILEGAGQAPHIIADVRGQAGMTRELAMRAARRAFGADTMRRIRQMRIIGRDFDLTIPRLPD